MPKFQRRYELNLETADGSIVTITDPLTLEFTLTRHIHASANTAELRVYNLGAVTRNRIYKNRFNIVHRPMSLRGGYSKQLPVIFKGNIREAISYKEEGSANFLTVISGFDNGSDISESFSHFTLGKDTTKQDVILRLIKDLTYTTKGVISDKFGGKDSENNDVPENIYKRGRTIMGNTIKALEDETGNAVFIDNGKINVLKDQECLQGDITEFSAETGLLGSPKRSGTTLVVEMLFEPKVKIGQKITLNSQTEKNYNGEYKVVGFSHVGTISGSVSGHCKTVVSMWGSKSLEVISGV